MTITGQATTDAGASGFIRAPRQIIFGAGRRRGLGAVTAALGTNALVCTDARMAGAPEFLEMRENLRAAGVTVHVFPAVEAELPAGSIADCVDEVAARTLSAHAAADALSHCVEAFTAIRHPSDPALSTERVFVGKSLLTDSYALSGIELIGRSIVAACSGGDDRSARAELHLGALYGGLALGTAGTAAAHALQYPIGALTHTPHGAGVGALLPYVMAYNLSARTTEFAAVAAALRCPSGSGGATEDGRAQAAVRRVAELLGTVGIPRDLAELGLSEDRLDWVAERGMSAARLVDNNPRPLDSGEMGRILRAAFDGDLDSLLGQ